MPTVRRNLRKRRGNRSRAAAARMPVFDFLKAAASQLIVLHHLALYGPVAEAFDDLLPEVSAWFVEYGRLAVQVFLVLGGFFAVRSLAPAGVGVFVNPLALLWKRYCRLVVPFAVAVGLAAVTAAVARLWLSDDMVPDRAGLLQVLAHLLLLHGIVGAESLSAGVWYVAIDFQLFAMMLGLSWLSRRFTVPWAAPFAVALVALASLYFFNRDADWDDWGLYFFGAYALGAFACWERPSGGICRGCCFSLAWRAGLDDRFSHPHCHRLDDGDAARGDEPLRLDGALAGNPPGGFPWSDFLFGLPDSLPGAVAGQCGHRPVFSGKCRCNTASWAGRMGGKYCRRRRIFSLRRKPSAAEWQNAAPGYRPPQARLARVLAGSVRPDAPVVLDDLELEAEYVVEC